LKVVCINYRVLMKNKKSLIFAIEEIATLLRKEAKYTLMPLKKPTIVSSSLSNSVQQIAQLLRSELLTTDYKKNHSWVEVKKRK
jgi:hypothetical protein